MIQALATVTHHRLCVSMNWKKHIPYSFLKFRQRNRYLLNNLHKPGLNYLPVSEMGALIFSSIQFIRSSITSSRFVSFSNS
jgi:hypothetical protein